MLKPLPSAFNNMIQLFLHNVIKGELALCKLHNFIVKQTSLTEIVSIIYVGIIINFIFIFSNE